MIAGSKTDFKRELDCYRARRGVFRVLEVPRLQYLMVDGHGDPNTSVSFRDALAALYPVAYKLKFASKNDLGKDFTVMPLEGLWWADDMSVFTTARDKSKWDFAMMIMQPHWIDGAMFDAARREVSKKGAPARLGDVRLETLDEGTAVQTLHVGTFDTEAATWEAMRSEFLPRHRLRMTGKHHEIYLSDLRRTAPERMRIILRQPVTE